MWITWADELSGTQGVAAAMATAEENDADRSAMAHGVAWTGERSGKAPYASTVVTCTVGGTFCAP